MDTTSSKECSEGDAAQDASLSVNSSRNYKSGGGSPSFDKGHGQNSMPAQRNSGTRHNFSSTNLFIYDLDHSIDQEILEKHFSVFGKILSSAVMRNIHTGESLGTAFVEFETHEQAHEAMVEMSGSTLEGKTIFVQWARKHERIPVGEARRKIMKLFVRNIPLDITVEGLTAFFSAYGTVNQITIHKDTAPVLDPMLVRHIAFVIYGEEGSAEKAAIAVQNTKPFESCNGIPLMVKLAEDNGRERKHYHTADKSSGSFKKKPLEAPLPISPPQQYPQFPHSNSNSYSGWGGGPANPMSSNFVAEEHLNTPILLRHLSGSEGPVTPPRAFHPDHVNCANLCYDRESHLMRSSQQSGILSSSQARISSFRNQSPGCVRASQRTQSSVSFLNFEDYPIYPATPSQPHEPPASLSRPSTSSQSLQHSRMTSFVLRDDFYDPAPMDAAATVGPGLGFGADPRGAYSPAQPPSRASSEITDPRAHGPRPLSPPAPRYEDANADHMAPYPRLRTCASSGGFYAGPAAAAAHGMAIPNPRSALARAATVSVVVPDFAYPAKLYPKYTPRGSFFAREENESEAQPPELRMQRKESTVYSDWNSVNSPISEGDPNTAGEISIKSRTSSYKEIFSGGKRGYRHNPYSFHADSQHSQAEL